MNDFVVYSPASTMEIKSYKRLFAAAAYAEKYGYMVATREYYNNSVVKMVERVNLMSGKKFWEKSNTPCYCSPACESYWSM